MAQAIKRIEKEYKNIINDKKRYKKIYIIPYDEIDDLFNWEVCIKGPQNTPYEGKCFKLSIEFPKDYPFKPPEINFITKIFHANIHSTGEICCQIYSDLKDSWAPDKTINQILVDIFNILEKPNFHTCFLYGYNFYTKDKCERDHDYYYRTAKEYSEKYAENVDDYDFEDEY